MKILLATTLVLLRELKYLRIGYWLQQHRKGIFKFHSERNESNGYTVFCRCMGFGLFIVPEN